MNNYKNTVAYFEHVASVHPLITDFKHMRWQEILSGGDPPTGWLLLMEDFEGRGFNIKNGNESKPFITGLYLIRQCNKEDAEEILNAYTDAEAMLEEIVLKVDHDADPDTMCNAILPAGFTDAELPHTFDARKGVVHPVGPLFTDAFGCRLVLPWSGFQSKEYDPNLWQV